MLGGNLTKKTNTKPCLLRKPLNFTEKKSKQNPNIKTKTKTQT